MVEWYSGRVIEWEPLKVLPRMAASLRLFTLPLYHFTTLSLLLLLFMMPLSSARASSIDANAGTGGANFMKIGAGNARALALGRAYVALAEGADALVWNPAGLAAASQRELQVGILDWVQDFRGEYLGYVHPTGGRAVLGGNFGYFSLKGFDARDSNGVPLVSSQVEVRNFFATLSIARSFLYEKLFFGLSAKNIHEDYSGPVTDVIVGDVGLIYKPREHFSIGASWQNLGDKEKVAQTVRWGLAWQAGDFLQVSMEMAKDSDNRSRLGLGAELLFPEELVQVGQAAFRVGYYDADSQGINQESALLKRLRLDRTAGVSFGAGVFTHQAFGYGIGVDYSMSPMGALGVAHQFMLKFKF